MKAYKKIGVISSCFALGFAWILFAGLLVDEGEVNPAAEAAKEGEEELSEVYPERLRTEHFEVAVAFEGEPTEALKQLILRDINFVFNHKKVNFIYEEDRKDMPIQTYLVDGIVYESFRLLHMEGPGRPPDFLWSRVGQLIDRDGRDYLVISSELVEAYRDASDVIVRNPGMLEALDDLIEDLNNAEQWSLEYDHLSRRYYLQNETSQARDETSQIKSNLRHNPEGVVEHNSRHEWMESGLLNIRDFSFFPHFEEEVYGTEVHGWRGGDMKSGQAAVYIGGEWKLFFPNF